MQCKEISDQSLRNIRLVLVLKGHICRDRQEDYQTDRLRDRRIKHRVNLITSMRFRTWELSVICTTETKDTVGERREHNHDIKK